MGTCFAFFDRQKSVGNASLENSPRPRPSTAAATRSRSSTLPDTNASRGRAYVISSFRSSLQINVCCSWISPVSITCKRLLETSRRPTTSTAPISLLSICNHARIYYDISFAPRRAPTRPRSIALLPRGSRLHLGCSDQDLQVPQVHQKLQSPPIYFPNLQQLQFHKGFQFRRSLKPPLPLSFSLLFTSSILRSGESTCCVLRGLTAFAYLRSQSVYHLEKC